MYERGLLSVVLVTYNLYDYVQAAVESVLSSTYQKLELIIVDDGSTDGTIDYLNNLADSRLRIVVQSNNGLSAGRNAGVRLAKGEFIAFLDGDDFVPRDAYMLMINSLNESGSDMVSGLVDRLDDATNYRFLSPHFQKGITGNYKATTIFEHPELVYDSTAWNKVYRHSFYVDNQVEFPIGRLYEDIPTELRMHLLASKIDMTTDVVYVWRIRAGKMQSITQNRLEKKNIVDRLAMLDMTYIELGDRENTDRIIQTMNYKVLNQDIFVHVSAMGNISRETLEENWRLITTFIAKHNLQSAINNLPITQKIMYVLFLNGDFVGFQKYVRTYGKSKVSRLFAVVGQLIKPRVLRETILNR